MYFLFPSIIMSTIFGIKRGEFMLVLTRGEFDLLLRRVQRPERLKSSRRLFLLVDRVKALGMFYYAE